MERFRIQSSFFLVLLVVMHYGRLVVAYVHTQKIHHSTTRKYNTRYFSSGRKISLKGGSTAGANGKCLWLTTSWGSGSLEESSAMKMPKISPVAKQSVRGVSKGKNGNEPSTNSKKGASKAKRKAPKEYWSEDDDEAVFEFKESCGDATTSRQISKVHFKIRGNPRPLRRHRTSRGIMYNPSEKLQTKFRETVQSLVFTDDTIPQPMFEDDQILVISIVFRLRRARHNFIGNKAGPGRMRDTAPHATSQTRTDVDNLIKFVLDAMNHVLYEDDRQITSIRVTKILDDEGLCEGSTEILLRSIDKEDVEGLISESLQII